MPQYGVGHIPLEDALEVAFESVPFWDFWPRIEQYYTEYNFSDALTDNERIAEYSQIAQTLKQYISSSKTKVFSMLAYPEAIITWANEQKDKQEETYPKTRRDLVNKRLKTEWLNRLIDQVEYVIEEGQ